MNRIISNCLVFLLFACCSDNQKKKNSDDSVYSHKTLNTENYDRFILVRGDKLKSAEEKLNEFGQLSAPGKGGVGGSPTAVSGFVVPSYGTGTLFEIRNDNMQVTVGCNFDSSTIFNLL
jgi:hypothetical protein